ncbi:MAG: UDP-N-acetylmuramoyl-L-alanyl-D-glutamate--2,6-diaminopimelate ligase [Treponema sp.]|jgi:UDP-N-acetylmuramoyl-L-alanyl-D-glutamate--2,6-diaminopimelate ligase|nr:UDP-N-acetylmuramoyl-L-alanyl-D-glutamate--2,6-diaminopimelate ligase [Treponema sp.]
MARIERRLSEFFTKETAAEAGYTGDGAKAAPAGLSADPVVTGLEYDSRKVKPGNLYFALPGLHTDGHRYIGDAVKKGAAVIVHEAGPGEKPEGPVYLGVKNSRFAMSPVSAAFYGCPSRRLIVCGVTGTEGKSTTVFLIWQLLRLLGKKAGFFSTVQYSTGGEAEWNPEHQTTPEAPAVQRLLWEMAENGAEYAVVEASSHGLSERTNRLGNVDFDAAVFTNVTHEHLEFHGTWEQYRYDKANLFRALDRERVKVFNAAARGNSADGKAGMARVPEPFGVINADDPSADYFTEATKRRTLTYSVRGMEADLSVHSIESGAFGNWYEALVAADRDSLDIRDQLPGGFNTGNVLAALLALQGLTGKSVRETAPLAARLKPVRGRMTAVNRGQPFEALVDYAHTPSSFSAIFPPLRERINKTKGRIISLFGSAGERDTGKRSRQGRIAADYSDILILTDEDPRGEKSMDILEEIAAGAPERKRGKDLFLIPDRPAAIRKAFSLARPGDLVLLLGKGHENSIIYAEKTVAYDEIGEAEKALEERGFKTGSYSSLQSP